jgi:predicted Rossmann fold flavoprotein
MSQRFDVIIIGAGGAGLMCAMTAGQRGRSVAVLEHNDRIGKKILISGGGRCNFTNLDAGPENYISSNPHFCRSALSRYPAGEFIELVRKHGIEFYEKTLGQLFCKQSSRQIVGLLEGECRDAGVDIFSECKVNALQGDNGFQLQTSLGDFECESLVIATGALSFSKLGATDFGYRVAKQFGVPIVGPRPGLVPIIPKLGDGSPWPFIELSGISISCVASAGGQSFRDQLLFTHRGLSGPAVLQVSNYCRQGETFALNLLVDETSTALLDDARQSRKTPDRWLEKWFPKRFAHAFAKQFVPAKSMAQMKQTDRERLVKQLLEWKLIVAKTEGYTKAEVTVGGVDTNALSSKTMECCEMSGLYFIGEVLDVTGWLGGYNFQWAWASGHAAGQMV